MYSQMPKRPYISASSMLPTHPTGRVDGRGVYVPPNYSGTAIDRGEPLPSPPEDTPPPAPMLAVVETNQPSPEEREPERDIQPVPTPPKAGHVLGELLGGATFPFGHGMGFEELFLLGLLLFLKHQDTQEGDDLWLTLLLLGALLFCG